MAKGRGGRPTAYKPEYADQAFKYCLLGADDRRLAELFGVRESTLNLWKKKHPEFMEAIKKGRDIADAEVARSLYRRALGYKYEEKTIENGEVVKTVVKEVPPETTAAIFWLKNRHGDAWRDRQEIAHTGETKHTVTHDISKLSVDELRNLVELMKKAETAKTEENAR